MNHGFRRYSVFLFLTMLVVSILGCGASSTALTTTVGPQGPTSPSAYYFNLTITPSVVSEGTATVAAIVQLWDSNGRSVSGYSVLFTGDFATTTGLVTTDSSGTARFAIDVTSTAGHVSSVTATVENISLAASYRVTTY